MKIAIIGAGAAGLVAIKFSIEEGYECEAFEQTEVVGGTWNYVDEVGLDKNGFPIRTSMYKNLRTNLPKEVMMFENFPYKATVEESFITQPQVLEYMNDFAEKNDLKKHIKFNTLVTYVEPAGNNKWDVEVQDTISKTKETKRFDYVVVANGKYHVPNMPNIPGLETFTGNCIHSHHFRSVEPYTDKVVLIVGAGFSGIDISLHVNQVAKKVFFSFEPSSPYASFISNEVNHKPLIHRIKKNKVFFENGSEEIIDEIILCTGYLYSFPFLSEKCGVVVDDSYVKGLYKEFICIEFPTMMFLCIPGAVCPIPTFEIQMRFAFAILNGHFHLPPKDVMLKEAEDERRSKNCSNRKFHRKGLKGEKKYWDDLAKTASVKNVPNVVFKIHDYFYSHNRNMNHRFRIINDEEFEVFT